MARWATSVPRSVGSLVPSESRLPPAWRQAWATTGAAVTRDAPARRPSSVSQPPGGRHERGKLPLSAHPGGVGMAGADDRGDDLELDRIARPEDNDHARGQPK